MYCYINDKQLQLLCFNKFIKIVVPAKDYFFLKTFCGAEHHFLNSSRTLTLKGLVNKKFK